MSENKQGHSEWGIVLTKRIPKYYALLKSVKFKKFILFQHIMPIRFNLIKFINLSLHASLTTLRWDSTFLRKSYSEKDVRTYEVEGFSAKKKCLQIKVTTNITNKSSKKI